MSASPESPARGSATAAVGPGLIVDASALDVSHAPVVDALVTVGLAAESAGFASLWIAEQRHRIPGEPYSLLGALATATERIHLGAWTDGPDRRAPSLVAKLVTGIDVISHGRALLAWRGDATDRDGAARLDEGLRIARAVASGSGPTVIGRFWSVDRAVNRPQPVQVGGVPSVAVVTGSGPWRSDLLTTAVPSADVVVIDGEGPVIAEARIIADGVEGPSPGIIALVEDTDVGAGCPDGADGVLVRWGGNRPEDIAELLSGL